MKRHFNDLETEPLKGFSEDSEWAVRFSFDGGISLMPIWIEFGHYTQYNGHVNVDFVGHEKHRVDLSFVFL